MTPSAVAPLPGPARRRSATAAAQLPLRHDTAPNATAAAILHELQLRPGRHAVRYLAAPGESSDGARQLSRPADVYLVGAHLEGATRHAGCPCVVYRHRPHDRTGPVVVALDDDANTEFLAEYAASEALRLGVALRAVHVWTESEPPIVGRRMCRHDRMRDADALLTTVLYECPTLAGCEREILHDALPARALAELSHSASLIVVGAHSRAPYEGSILGRTTIGLLDRTDCPLAVLPQREYTR